MRMAVEAILGNLKDIETRHIEEMLETLEKPAGRSINLPADLIFRVEYDRYILGYKFSGLCPLPELEGQAILNVPGETVFSGWRITTKIISGEKLKSTGINRFMKNPDSIDGESYSRFHSGLTANFDYDRLGDKLIMRTVQSGDRFQPLGLNETKKISRFMIDARIPRNWRPRIPIIASPEHIIWVAGWRIDERVKVTGDTNKILRMEVKIADPDQQTTPGSRKIPAKREPIDGQVGKAT